MNNQDTILYTAYKNFLISNINSGFFRQHLSESDYYAFGEFQNLFLEIFALNQEKRMDNSFLKGFFEHNPKYKTDIEFSKKIFSLIKDERNFSQLFEFFPPETFINDLNLIKKAIKNTNGDCFFYKGFEPIRINSELRNQLIENYNSIDKLSLTWFDLPKVNYFNDKIKQIILDDGASYINLADELKTKELTLDAIESHVNTLNKRNFYIQTNTHSISSIYDSMPINLRKDLDVSNALSRMGFTQHFADTNYSPETFKAWISNQNLKNFPAISQTIQDNPSFMKNNTNVFYFFDWFIHSINKIEKIKDYTMISYSNYYKCVNSIIKNNAELKEYVKNNPDTHDLHLGSISENKNTDTRDLLQFLDLKLEKSFATIKFNLLKEQIEVNNTSTKNKPKI